MFINFKKIFSVLLVLVIGVGIGVGTTKLIQRYQEPKQTVSVVGTGEVDATTDQANITIQIKTVSTTYEKAQLENKTDVDNLKSELTKLGIPESRITVSSYSQPILSGLEPEFNTIEYPELKMMPRPPVNNSPTVTTDLNLVINPIKNIEKIFDLVSKNTNAQITNTYYSLKNRKTYESKAKEEAVKDARVQVESVAKINHLRVGKLVSLEDNNNPRPYMMELKTTDNSSGNDITQSALAIQETDEANTFYSEQSVKITSSYTATYELY